MGSSHSTPYVKSILADIDVKLAKHYPEWSYTVPEDENVGETIDAIRIYMKGKLGDAPVQRLTFHPRTIVIDMKDYIPDMESIVETNMVELLNNADQWGSGGFMNGSFVVSTTSRQFDSKAMEELFKRKLANRGYDSKWELSDNKLVLMHLQPMSSK